MKNIKITLKTLTPLWTGDAWEDNRQIRTSSIMGSLRFWFEVICYFSGITNKENYENGKLTDNVDEKQFKEKVLSNGNDFEGIDKTLTEFGISLPSRIFGCTGWNGWLRIKQITPIQNYCFGNNLNLFYAIAIKKNNHVIKEFKTRDDLNDFINKNYNDKRNWHEKQKAFKKEWAVWYLGIPYFWGKFEIIFKIEKNIKDSIFYPLLTFVEKYGFLGGKWNIGYGRIKIKKVEEKEEKKENDKWKENKNWRKEEFEFNNKTINFSDFINEESLSYKGVQSFDFIKYFLGTDNFYCNKERNFEDKISSIPRKIKIAKFDNLNGSYIDLIKELLKKKTEMRNCLRPGSSVNNRKIWNDFRHELLGTTSGGTQGTKIIPWIYEDKEDLDENGNPKLKGGFVSIAGILNLGG